MKRYSTICLGLLLAGVCLSQSVETGALTDSEVEGEDLELGGFLIPSKTAQPTKALRDQGRTGDRRLQALDALDDDWEDDFLPRQIPSQQIKEVELLHGGGAYAGIVQPKKSGGVEVGGGMASAQWQSFQATANAGGESDAIKPILDPKTPPKQPPHAPPEKAPPSSTSNPQGIPQKEEQEGQHTEAKLGECGV